VHCAEGRIETAREARHPTEPRKEERTSIPHFACVHCQGVLAVYFKMSYFALATHIALPDDGTLGSIIKFSYRRSGAFRIDE
jgi:hypothetical protein